MTSTLSNENINTACDSFENILSNLKIDRKTALRSRFAFEEVLLKYQKEFGERQEFEWHEEKKFGRHNIKISVRAGSFDPFSTSQEETVMHRLLENMGDVPGWSYKNNSNYVVFSFSKQQKISELAKILIAILSAILLGLIFNFNHEVAVAVSETFLAPVFDTIMGVIIAFATVMIFLSVVNGICGMGDISALQNIGKKLIASFLTMLFIYGLIGLAALLPFFHVQQGERGTLDIVPIYTMFLGIIPKNIFTPFIDGNSLQVIVIAICVGIAILASGEKLALLQSVISQINIVVLSIITTIIKLLPVAVFISIFRIVATNQLDKIFSSYKYVVLHLICAVVSSVVAVLRMAVMQKVSPVTYIKKFLPTGMISLATASSMAAFSTNVDTCEHKLGIDNQFVNVGLPLGQVVFMPGVLHELMVSYFFMCELYGQAITWGAVLTVFLMAYLLSVANPPLPSAAIACHILLLTQMGIPVEGIAIIMAFNFIVDRIYTTFNLLALQAELVNVADKIGFLDKEKLRDVKFV